ncbi:MAG: hypothetical protein KA257_06315 [Opitutaceae bacterium]|nr:hypothetical protein [Opitutaceae bacterium]MBP9912415.1 hypothetical protein [Opitutaceae bacterium]
MPLAPITDTDRQRYRETGYHILRQVIPASLLRDLRREAAKAHDIAVRLHGPQTQRLAPLKNHAAELDLRPFRDFDQIDGLVEAIKSLLTPEHYLKPIDDACILFGPRERPWSTEWHRDWRDHVLEDEFQAEIGDARWQEIATDFRLWNQVNCPLYEDISTWYVPGSFKRVHNTAEEMRVYASTNQQELWDEDRRRTDEELEMFCLGYCQAMPGAVQLILNPGDFCIYRNVGWHIGNYVPYRRRATISTNCFTPAYAKFAKDYAHMLKAVPAGVARHARLAAQGQR